MKPGDRLTGKVFESVRCDGDTVVENESFQLEAVIDGERTRLQSPTPIPESCIYDSRHSGLKLRGTNETFPPTYIVDCDCGYTVGMKDVNEGFRYFDKFQ